MNAPRSPKTTLLPHALRSGTVLALAALLAPVLTGADGGCGDDVSLGGDEGCEVDGVGYDVGETFPSSDGCNTCECTADGGVACTEMACAPVDGCVAPDGTVHDVGASFPSSDGCNSCYCEADGSILCTERGCGPDDGCAYDGERHPVGASFPSTDGCNTCFCDEDGQVSCTEMACACDPELACDQALTCFGDLLYPTGCGPANCDAPIGPCEEPACDPTLACGDALTCVDGELYPSTCGPANCDEPIGPCEE